MGHKRRPLAQYGSVGIEQCCCGIIYVHLGPTTVRLHPSDLLALRRASTESVEILQRPPHVKDDGDVDLGVNVLQLFAGKQPPTKA